MSAATKQTNVSSGNPPQPSSSSSSSSTREGVYKIEAVKDAAESLNIALSDAVASALASDVEYRIHQVIEEATRFMRHGRRTTLTTSDIENAFKVLNIEPLYGHHPARPPSFRRAGTFPHLPLPGTVYFVEDEEIDFDRVLREEKITLNKGVSWTAHWLAVEGVQPLVPENPPAIPREAPPEAGADPTAAITDGVAAPQLANGIANNVTGAAATKRQQQQQQQEQQQQLLVKQVLSRELQLYYNRLTTSLIPSGGVATSDFSKRALALGSLRRDAGLQALLPYLIRWVGEGVVNALKEGVQTEDDGRVLEVMLDVTSALLENTNLFVEPYLHQLLPPILSTLLYSSLPASHGTHLRTIASQTLSHVLRQHSTTYPSLSPRIMKTLLVALVSPGKSKGTREGAIRGLVGVGKEAVRKGLVESGGARLVDNECAGGNSGSQDSEALIKAVMDALKVLRPTTDSDSDSEMVYSLEMSNEQDAEVVMRLRELLGDTFAEKVCSDAVWARELLGRGRTATRTDEPVS